MKSVRRVLDIAVSFLDALVSLLVVAACGLLGSLLLLFRWLNARLSGHEGVSTHQQAIESQQKRKLLCLVPATLEALEKKGVAWMILERDEGGYFDHVYTVHFLLHSPHSQTVVLNEQHTVIEFGLRLYFLRRTGFFYTCLALNAFLFLCQIGKLIERERISIIRAQDPHLNGILGLILERFTGCPCAISIHADYDKRYEIAGKYQGAPVILGSRALGRLVERIVLSKARMVMPIRETLGEWAVARGANPERIRIIPHGVHVQEFLRPADPQLKKEFGLEGKRLVVFVGRLHQMNYVEDILKTTTQVMEHFPEVVFLFVGEGPERENLCSLAKELKAEGNVKFTGYQPWNKVVDFRLNADVNLCLMAGFSLIEAALSAKPVIAYDVEWHCELVKNGETGFLIKEHDVDAVANAIITLLDDPQLAQGLGSNARRLAMERHSMEATSRIKVQWYDELLRSGIE